MAFLMLLHEKMRLQRKVNKLTLRQLQTSKRKERITKNIARIQKMYSSKMTQIESQAKTATSQFSVWSQQMSGLGGNQSMNPWNFGMSGGISTFVMQGLAKWATQGTQRKDKNDEWVTVCDSDTATAILNAAQNGTLTRNVDKETQKPVQGQEWTDGTNTFSDDQYNAYQAAMRQCQQAQSYAQAQVQQMQSQHQTMVSIWEANAKAQLEAEQDMVLAPLEAEETEMDLENTSIEAQLQDARARLEGIDQACKDGIKNSAPTFGLG